MIYIFFLCVIGMIVLKFVGRLKRFIGMMYFGVRLSCLVFCIECFKFVMLRLKVLVLMLIKIGVVLMNGIILVVVVNVKEGINIVLFVDIFSVISVKDRVFVLLV